MKKYNIITPEGTRDLLFNECTVRREIETKLMELFKNRGYSEVITPFLEFYDTFDSYFPQESMYKLTDSKGRLMVIRPDSTLPIIRLAETRLKDEPRPLKLCYNQTIYRANPKEAGRDDEIAQCGIERIASENWESEDNEILKLAIEALELIAGENYRLEIGNYSFLKCLFKENEIDDKMSEEICKLIEQKNYSALSVMKIPDIFVQLPKLFGGGEVFERAEKLFETDSLKGSLKALKEIYYEMRRNVKGDRITVDLSLTDKQGYYTGVIFNGYAAGYGKPVLSGGMYNVRNTLAHGFAINVSAVANLRGK
ncbi:MAG: ATP phosphoribosyltransferase regulatory subunit [Oscillospiraceae bacterium]|nr:ATP phosphoribosyltransferase regulatory subunit [Oscillospiraceae bacterium]